MNYKDVVIAVDGSLFRHHPHFHNVSCNTIRITQVLQTRLGPQVMKSRVAQLMGVEYKFDLMQSEDGSGRGAALVAAVLQSPHPAKVTAPQWSVGDFCRIM